MLFVAAQQKIDAAKVTVTCDVGLGRSEAGGFALTVKLAAPVPGLDAAAAKMLVDVAHQVCPFSNATRGIVPVELVVV